MGGDAGGEVRGCGAWVRCGRAPWRRARPGVSAAGAAGRVGRAPDRHSEGFRRGAEAGATCGALARARPASAALAAGAAEALVSAIESRCPRRRLFVEALLFGRAVRGSARERRGLPTGGSLPVPSVANGCRTGAGQTDVGNRIL